MPESVFRDRGCPSAKAYVKDCVMPVVAAQIIGTRPMLWASLCKCRSDPIKLPPETRARALELLAGGELLQAIGRLEGAGVREILSEFLVDLRTLIQADKVSPAFRSNKLPLVLCPVPLQKRSRL